MIQVTPRQQEIVEGMLNGESRKEIAFRLQISTHTVEAHISALYRIFGASSVAHLIGKMYGLSRV